MNLNTRKTITIDGEKITASVGLLNTISLWASEAAKSYDRYGANGLGNSARQAGQEIYEQLKAMGLYKDCK